MNISNEEVYKMLNEVKELLNRKEPILATITEASEKIGIGQHKLRELSYMRDFPIIKIGAKRLVNMNKINEWLEKHEGEVL